MGPAITRTLAAVGTALTVTAAAIAHDTWLQTNIQIVRAGDTAHVDLMLGNHGNDHRDYKLASKTSLDGATLTLVDPAGESTGLIGSLKDVGLSEKEGYWTAIVTTSKPGLYTLVHTLDKVVSYAPKRSVKSAKAFLVASKSLDRVGEDNPGFDRVYGHALELIPLTNPVTPMGPGQKLKVKLLLHGKPLADTVVSFIPRGVQLTESFDERYERRTDAEGVATFEFRDANYYLIAAHHEDATAKGEGYDSTKYSATLTVFVPALCPCCGD